MPRHLPYIYSGHYTDLCHAATEAGADHVVLLFSSEGLLLNENGALWESSRLGDLAGTELEYLLVGLHEGRSCLTARVGEAQVQRLGARAQPLRQFLMEQGPEAFGMPGQASQLLNWYHSHRYCGSCGRSTAAHATERALVCRPCGQSYYPRINPCIIVLVSRGPRLLLARHSRTASGYFSCLAGFIEVGETPEETVRREVEEEVGIQVENIRYVQSQSWPFPSQLMLGFFADYRSGEIQPDGVEIAEAGWFSPEELPPTPSARFSVAGELIRARIGSP